MRPEAKEELRDLGKDLGKEVGRAVGKLLWERFKAWMARRRQRRARGR